MEKHAFSDEKIAQRGVKIFWPISRGGSGGGTPPESSPAGEIFFYQNHFRVENMNFPTKILQEFLKQFSPNFSRKFGATASGVFRAESAKSGGQGRPENSR